jgi:pyruvate kinase
MNRRTKIICTLGPATDAPGVLRSLISAGLDVARLNFSHGSFDEHERRIRSVRDASRDLKRPIAILADLPGPKIRIGTIESGTVRLRRSADFTLTLNDVPGDENVVTLHAPAVFKSVRPDHSLFLDDGIIELKVTEVSPTEIRTKVVNGGDLSGHKGLALPGVPLDTPSLTEEDLKALEFISKSGEIDWIAVSFVRSPNDIRDARKELVRLGRPLPLIAKIEQHEAVDNLDEILQEADSLMVARGDLGVERPIYQVPILQKQIIAKCKAVGKPVITATQMLDSMIRNPRPTRAEVTDVANAVLDGTDCVMLSGETAVGKYPNETVRLMRQVILQAEGQLTYKATAGVRLPHSGDEVTEAICQATCDIAYELNAAAIITATRSGHTARMVSRHRPLTPIIGITSEREIYNRLALTWGVSPALTPRARDTDETISFAIETAIERKLVKKGDLVVITAGVPTGVSGHTNLIKVHSVGSPMIDRASE